MVTRARNRGAEVSVGLTRRRLADARPEVR